jgi:hypothetical protein
MSEAELPPGVGFDVEGLLEADRGWSAVRGIKQQRFVLAGTTHPVGALVRLGRDADAGRPTASFLP